MSDFKKVEKTDVVMLLGLILIGVGLFFWHGLGVALTVDGALLFIIGFLPGFLPAILPQRKQ